MKGREGGQLARLKRVSKRPSGKGHDMSFPQIQNSAEVVGTAVKKIVYINQTGDKMIKFGGTFNEEGAVSLSATSGSGLTRFERVQLCGRRRGHQTHDKTASR